MNKMLTSVAEDLRNDPPPVPADMDTLAILEDHLVSALNAKELVDMAFANADSAVATIELTNALSELLSEEEVKDKGAYLFSLIKKINPSISDSDIQAQIELIDGLESNDSYLKLDDDLASIQTSNKKNEGVLKRFFNSFRTYDSTLNKKIKELRKDIKSKGDKPASDTIGKTKDDLFVTQADADNSNVHAGIDSLIALHAEIPDPRTLSGYIKTFFERIVKIISDQDTISESNEEYQRDMIKLFALKTTEEIGKQTYNLGPALSGGKRLGILDFDKQSDIKKMTCRVVEVIEPTEKIKVGDVKAIDKATILELLDKIEDLHKAKHKSSDYILAINDTVSTFVTFISILGGLLKGGLPGLIIALVIRFFRFKSAVEFYDFYNGIFTARMAVEVGLLEYLSKAIDNLEDA